LRCGPALVKITRAACRRFPLGDLGTLAALIATRKSPDRALPGQLATKREYFNEIRIQDFAEGSG
jgi:hypothetical protein